MVAARITVLCMRLTTSFTRGVRYPAPDVARGLMLLLIAVANVPSWTDQGMWKSVTGDQVPGYSVVDSVWVLVRSMLVDARSYPLFAMLFGFGVVTMANRRVESGRRAYLESATGGRPELATPAQEVWAREQARVNARCLVRRRGWWMVLFGAVHSVFFSGDIIGAYGLVAVVFAGWLVNKHRGRAIAVSSVIILLSTLGMLYQGWFMVDGLKQLEEAGEISSDALSDASAGAWAGLPWVVSNPLTWVSSTIAAPLFSMVVPAVFVGARLADTDVLAHPERHRRWLALVAVGGLGTGALGGLHAGLASVGWAEASMLDLAVSWVTGLFGACGWLALLALYAGGPRAGGGLRGLRRLASAVGRRSMTAYLGQTVLFGLVFMVVPGLLGAQLSVGEAGAAVIAVVVWLVTVGACLLLERGGHAGPFEVALRTLVARSEKKRLLPVPPPSPADQPVTPAVGPVAAGASPRHHGV